MTKEEASDLKSYIDSLIQRELDFLQATLARAEAQRQLAFVMRRLQNSPKIAPTA